MPSPIGHALGGAAAGLAVASMPGIIWQRVAFFAVLGMLPDIDLLFGGHRGPTHSLGTSLIAGLTLLAFTRNPRLSLASAAAYGSHTLLDWLGSDSSPPIGVMALWPITREYYESSVHVFYAVSRRYWMPGFVAHNVRALAWELVVLVPALAVVLAGTRLVASRTPPRANH
ncbi:MAG: metal-dependent hydrolase [Vicinamibacterales bacterium]